MLAGMKDYAFVWQLPFIGIFIVGWVLGGGWLLHRGMKRLQDRKLTFARCLVGSTLAGLCSAFTAVAILLMMRAIGARMETNLLVAGAIAGAATGLVVVYVVLLAVFNQPLRKILVHCTPAVAAVALLAVVIGAICFFPARNQQLETRLFGECKNNLQQIDGVIRKYELVHHSSAATLAILKAAFPDELAKSMKCPDDDSPRKESYCYLATSSLPMPQGDVARSSKVRLCDYKGNHGDKGRNVMMLDGTYRRVTVEEFQALLNLSGNKALAEKLQKEDP